ncbi:MAG TPA: protein-glutamate O-methyltransferase CheR [Pedomonas sp.]|uniref:CheR family methyltransferase n=1 Tax=Pedomonas sp. TaxID=2976421 RepID=UPI002F4049AD
MIAGERSFRSVTSSEEFQTLCEFIYRRTGMSFSEGRRYYVERRIDERIRATGANSFRAYFTLLRANTDGELEQLINSLTVNETYFYREEHQFRCLSSDLLPDIVSRKPAGQPVRIWSAPCSTGEEPYSIAIWLLENWPDVDAYDIEIVASDIDTQALSRARSGCYGARSLARLSSEIIERYFEPAGPAEYRINEELRSSIYFSSINLMDPAATRTQGRFDVIFCRNMLIYFDDASRRVAAENFYDCLEPGGYICLGHTEAMSRISPLFQVRRFHDAIVYQKPEEKSDA